MNYRNGYFNAEPWPGGRPLSSKQRRRLVKKMRRDAVAGGLPVNSTRPPALSGHPGRRRVQLVERQAMAEERMVVRALRRAEHVR